MRLTFHRVNHTSISSRAGRASDVKTILLKPIVLQEFISFGARKATKRSIVSL